MGKHNAVPYRDGKRRGKHAAPSHGVARAAGVTAASAVMALTFNQAAQAADTVDTEQVSELRKLIQCESSGSATVVNRSNSNRPAGAWQITTPTWRGYGGLEFAPTADQATLAEQNIVAIRVSKGQGAGAWECAPRGLTAPFDPRDVAAATGVGHIPAVPATVTPRVKVAPQAAEIRVPVAPKRKPAVAASPVAGEHYTVAPGDTLSGIALRHGDSDWHELYSRNVNVVGDDPNLIIPGQSLDVQD